jgi:cytosylglucuronate decarboxylase
MPPEYLFIRILEACNAGCTMCSFQRSRDIYRYPLTELLELLPRVRGEGIRYVRFTGGEPLMHPDIIAMVRAVTGHGLQASLITNGHYLPAKADALAEAGLGHVVVSIDGARPQTHDAIRRTPGLFIRAIAGLRAMRGRGCRCRVNTVCGPENFREMPELQALLTGLGVQQWELSSLKLERPLRYSPEDVIELDAVVRRVYGDGGAAGRLLPMGKVWCGSTPEERQRYLETGITPRPDGRCLVVDRVRYLDARNGMLYACSLTPHRAGTAASGAPVGTPCRSVSGPVIAGRADHFREHGPHTCTGCSTTAAGFSNTIAAGGQPREWDY